jgi:hypothetical protein
MVKALARAHRWQAMLEEGRCASVWELAGLLAADIVKRVLDGRSTLGRRDSFSLFR